MRGLLYSFMVWMLASSLTMAVAMNSDLDSVRGTMQTESQAENVEGLRHIQLTNGDGPFFYYTVTIGETRQDSCSYEYAFSENGVLYYLFNERDEMGQYTNRLRGFDAFTGEQLADDIKLINAGTTYELLNIAKSDSGYFVWAYDVNSLADYILQLSSEGVVVAEMPFDDIIDMMPDSFDFYYNNGKRVNVDSMVSDGRNVFVFFNGNIVRLTDGLNSVTINRAMNLYNACLGNDGIIYYNNPENGNIFCCNPSNNQKEYLLNPFIGNTKIFPDINDELFITDEEMIRTFNPVDKTVRNSFMISEFGLCEINIDDIFRDMDGSLHIVYKEQRVAYDTQNGDGKVKRHPYYVSRTTVLRPMGARIDIDPEKIDPYCDEKYNVTTAKIEESEPDFVEPLPRIVNDNYLYITLRKEYENGHWLLKRDISGEGRPDELHKLEVGALDSGIMNIAWTGNGEFIAYACDVDATTEEVEIGIVRMTDDGKLLKKKLVPEITELPYGDLWDKPISDGKNTYIIYGSDTDSKPVLLDKDFGYVREFPVNYSRNAFDEEGLLYLVDQLTGFVSYYDCKTDSFTPNVNHVILYPDELFNGGHKEVLVRKDACFFSYSSEDGITEKLFNMFDYELAVDEVYDFYREGDNSFVVVFKGYVTTTRLTKNGTYVPYLEAGTFKAVFERNE